MSRTQIGWYIQKEKKTITNHFQYAAAFEEVMTEPGRYPLVVFDMRIDAGGRVRGHANTAYARADGVITAAHCAGEVGDRGFGNVQPYLFTVAENVYCGKGDYELLPGFEAKEVRFEYGEQTLGSYCIFIK